MWSDQIRKFIIYHQAFVAHRLLWTGFAVYTNLCRQFSYPQGEQLLADKRWSRVNWLNNWIFAKTRNFTCLKNPLADLITQNGIKIIGHTANIYIYTYIYIYIYTYILTIVTASHRWFIGVSYHWFMVMCPSMVNILIKLLASTRRKLPKPSPRAKPHEMAKVEGITAVTTSKSWDMCMYIVYTACIYIYTHIYIYIHIYICIYIYNLLKITCLNRQHSIFMGHLP